MNTSTPANGTANGAANGTAKHVEKVAEPAAKEIGRRPMSHKEVGQAVKLLMLNGQPSEDGTTYTYNEGWSDQRIATEIGPHIKVDKVADVRIENMGRLPEELKKAEPKGSTARIAALEEEMTDLKTRLAKVESIAKQLE